MSYDSYHLFGRRDEESEDEHADHQLPYTAATRYHLFGRRDEEDEDQRADPQLPCTSNHLAASRYHPYERNMETTESDRIGRQGLFPINPSTSRQSETWQEAVMRNIALGEIPRRDETQGMIPGGEVYSRGTLMDSHSVGGLMPMESGSLGVVPLRSVQTEHDYSGGINPRKIISMPSDDLIPSGCGPAQVLPDPQIRRAIRGCHGSLAAVATGTPAQSEASTSADTNASSAYHPLPIGSSSTATQLNAAPPAYTVEMLSVGPGVVIPKKKFIPRYLPMPIGTRPSGLGRPILGRGASLDRQTPCQSDSGSSSSNQGQYGAFSGGATMQGSSAEAESIFTKESGEDQTHQAQISNWPFLN